MPLDLAAALDRRGIAALPGVTMFLAWVVSSTASAVTVKLADGSQATAPRARSYPSPIVDDVVLIAKAGSSLYCLCALNAAPTPPPAGDPADPQEPPRNVVTTATFRPITTGTYRGTAWRDDTTNLVQGDSTGEGLNTGAAYYGAGPSSVTYLEAVSGTVRVKRNPGGPAGPQTPTLRLLAEEARPAGAPTTVDTLTGPPLSVDQEATVTLPLTWVTALLSGTAGGIGVGVPTPTPYLVMAGTSAWSAAFELTLQWKA